MMVVVVEVIMTRYSVRVIVRWSRIVELVGTHRQIVRHTVVIDGAGD